MLFSFLYKVNFGNIFSKMISVIESLFSLKSSRACQYFDWITFSRRMLSNFSDVISLITFILNGTVGSFAIWGSFVFHLTFFNLFKNIILSKSLFIYHKRNISYSLASGKSVNKRWNRFFNVIRSWENLSSGEKRAGWALNVLIPSSVTYYSVI